MADIDTVINDAKEYAGELLEDARKMVDDAQTVASGRSTTNVQDIDWTGGEGDAQEAFDDVDPVSAFTDLFVLPEGSGLEDIAFQEPHLIENNPEFPEAPDKLDTSGLFQQQAPAWNLPDFTDTAPDVNTDLDQPDVPVVVLPEVPGDSSGIIVPDFTPPTFDDDMDLPELVTIDVTGLISSEFDSKRTELATQASEFADSWMVQHCPNYHEGMAALEVRISEALEAGNAYNETWEAANYDRAVIRVNDETARAQEAVAEDYGRRGFALPPGAAMAALTRIRLDSNRNLADTSANIANERARLEVQHLQFGMQLSSQLRTYFAGAMQNYFQLTIASNSQALEYAKEIGRWAKDIFDQTREIYTLEVQRYEAEASVYAVRLESSFALIKKFEVEIEAEKLKVSLDQNQIDLYEAKIRGELAKVQLYNGQLEGVRTQLQAEAQKIAVFESQVRAYSARIGGKSAEYDGYRAAIQGDSEKVRGYQAEVQAYGTGVAAVGQQVDVERITSQTIAQYNDQLISQRDSNLRRYETDVRAEMGRHGSQVDVQRIALARYSAEIAGRLRLTSTTFDGEALELKAAIERVRTNLDGQTVNVNSYLKAIGAQADITNAGANILGGMASSALTTNNAILTSEE